MTSENIRKTALNLAQWFSYYKRRKDKSFRLKHPLMFDPSYKDFIGAAKRVQDIFADPKVYVRAQFQEDDIEPSFLNTDEAERAWRNHVFDADAEVKQQEIYFSKAISNGMTENEAASAYWVPLKAWFRLQYIDNPSEELVDKAMEELLVDKRREAIQERGYSLDKIEKWEGAV